MMNFKNLKVMAVVTLVATSSIAQEAPPPEDTSTLDRFYFASSLEYSGASSAKSSLTKIKGTGVDWTGSSDFELDAAATISLEYGRIRENQFGFNIGLAYDTERTVKKTKYTGTGTPTFAEGKDKIAIMNLYLNGNYMIGNKIVLTAGLNRSFIEYKPGTGACSGAGSTGYQAGGSYNINSNWWGVLQYRLIRGDVKCSISGVDTDNSNVEISGPQLGFKYMF
jgi:opacity protein-like surface antigen